MEFCRPSARRLVRRLTRSIPDQARNVRKESLNARRNVLKWSAVAVNDFWRYRAPHIMFDSDDAVIVFEIWRREWDSNPRGLAP